MVDGRDAHRERQRRQDGEGMGRDGRCSRVRAYAGGALEFGAWSTDGARIASGNGDKTAGVWPAAEPPTPCTRRADKGVQLC